MIEIRIISYLIFLFSQKFNSSEVANYFVVQRLGSTIFLIGFLLMIGRLSSLSRLIITLSMFLKLGIAPFHWWAIRLVRLIPWERILLLLRVQKIIPIFIIFKRVISSYELLILLNLLVGIFGIFIFKSIKILIAYFTLIRSSWLLVRVRNLDIIFLYLLVFSLSLIRLCIRVFKNKEYIHEFNSSSYLGGVLFRLAILSMIGFPPLLGFYVKILLILNIIIISNFQLRILFLVFSSPFIIYNLIYTLLHLWKLETRLYWENTKEERVILLIIYLNFKGFGNCVN